MSQEANFKPRDQVRYSPRYGKDELGFIVRVRKIPGGSDIALCRFWEPVTEFAPELRTKVTSEAVNVDRLEHHDYGMANHIEVVCNAMGWP